MVTTSGDFFIVDNSDEHWKALEYLRQWCSISSGIDIATGHFEIGSLLALDGEWQKVGRIRVLLGGPSSRRTQEAVRLAASELDASLAAERRSDPFLTGLPAIVEALRSGQIEARVYRHSKFHAKAYITHSTLDVVGSAALVGSSNFTRPGLTGNVELNVRFTGAEVRDLQEWYEHYWEEAEPLTADLLEVMSRERRVKGKPRICGHGGAVMRDARADCAGCDECDARWRVNVCLASRQHLDLGERIERR